MNSGGTSGREAQGENVHVPVLLRETVEAISPRAGGIYADLTLGGGGHARAILERSEPDGFLLGLDRDSDVLEHAKCALKAFENRTLFRHGNFSEAAKTFEKYIGSIDGVIMDLGLSSYQLDHSRRGFSLHRDGPLDWRMDPTQSFSGKDLLNRGRPEELLFAIETLGEEPRSRAVVNAILEERKKKPLLHTSDIRGIVEKVYGRKGGRIHPATRTFMGLRMAVNEEIESLERGLPEAFRLMKEGGRLCVISFHSGEDRIAKKFFKDRKRRGEAEILSPKPLRPTASEIRKNRRSRSARLRVLQKI